MGEGFKKFKRRALRRAIFKSLLCGVSFGLIAAGGALLASKLVGVDLALWLEVVGGIALGFWVYVIIGVASALLCGGLTFLIFKKSDKQLAVELDKKFGLNEKVQTALAFAETSGEMYELQREDADAYLSVIPKKKYGIKAFWYSFTHNFSKIWQFIVILPLAAAIAATAIVMPSKVVEGAMGKPSGDEDFPFELSDAQIDDLNALLITVQESALDDSIKEPTIKSINRLMGNLVVAGWQSEKEELVGMTMRRINSLVASAISYKKIASSLANRSQIEFALIISDGAQIYRNYRLSDFENVETIRTDGVELVKDAIEEQVMDRFDLFHENMEKAAQEAEKGESKSRAADVMNDADVENGGEEKPKQDDKNTPAQIAMAVMIARVGTDDALYNVFMNVATELAQWRAGTGSDPRFTFFTEVSEALAEQAYIQAMERYVNLTLADIFSMRVPEDPLFEPVDNTTDDGEEEENKKGNGGGYGPGTLQGGSDDMIYDPNSGEYKKYIDILNEYYAIVEAMLREGPLTEEQQQVIRNYFEILYGPSAE